MHFQGLLLVFVINFSCQGINIGGILSAEQSIASNVLGQSSLVGAVATAARSALGGAESSRLSASSLTASQTANDLSSILTDSSAMGTSTNLVSSATSSSLGSRLASFTPSTSTASTLGSSPSQSHTTLMSSRSSSSTNITPAQAAASDSSASGPTRDTHSSESTDTLLEIILPTVLSGLTLLVLLTLIVWLCVRRRRRTRNRGSGMSHLYAAGPTVGSRHHSPAMMEERPESSLLQRASSPPVAPRDANHDNNDVTYVTPHASGAPAYSIRQQLSRPTSLHPSQRASEPLSHFSTSTSTNPASILAGSQHSGASRYSHGTRHSYQPIATDDRPAELSADQGSIENGNSLRIQQAPPARARTPPLQAMFPWYGPKSEARRYPKTPKGNALQGTSFEGPGGFDFAFSSDKKNSRASQYQTEGLTPTRNSTRFSIPRKPVPM